MDEIGDIKLMPTNEISILWTIKNIKNLIELFEKKSAAINEGYILSPPLVDGKLNDNSKWHFALYPVKRSNASYLN